MKKDKSLFLSNIKGVYYKNKAKVENIIYKHKWLFLIISVIFILYLITVVGQSYFVKWQSLYGSLVGVGATILGVNLTMANKYKEIYKKVLFQLKKCRIIKEVGDIRVQYERDFVFNDMERTRKVYSGVNSIPLMYRDMIYLERLFNNENKGSILDFVEDVKYELEHSLAGRLDNLVIYVKALERMKIFISSYRVVSNKRNSFDNYEYFLTKEIGNNGNTKYCIYANNFSLLQLIRFIRDCRDISIMENQLKKDLH